MVLPALVLIAGVLVETLGTIISVIGISEGFGGDPLLIAFILMLDIGKVTLISATYHYWGKLNIAMRGLSLVFILAGMSISSHGAAGYFSSAFDQSMVDTRAIQVKIDSHTEQLAKYELRKKQIDDQVANVSEKTSIAARIRLQNTFKAEQEAINERVIAIESELPNLKTALLGAEAKAGPIVGLSKSLNVNIETATKLIIGLLVAVFNPLAVFLIIMGNFMIAENKKAAIKPKRVYVRKPRVAKVAEEKTMKPRKPRAPRKPKVVVLPTIETPSEEVATA